MSSIHHLPESTINEIAAGEVIDRPASVVRELVDNSIDAGATLITVELEDGGHTLIRVADDGFGIESGDVKTAFNRHTTSKLHSTEDLNSLSTKGFRGEALSSIVAVSRVLMLTRSQQESSATELQLSAGEVQSLQSKPADTGTTIEVRSLYFNTPARRKFLKSDKAETDKIKQWLMKYSLPHPNVHFKLKSNSVLILELPKRATIFERAEQVFNGNFITVERKVGEFKIYGFLSHPSEAGSRSANFNLFINNRLVNDKAIARAVKDGYGAMLKSFESPVGFLSLQIPPELVDINVHPQKSEVRIANSNAVFGIVRETVRKAIGAENKPELPQEREDDKQGNKKFYDIEESKRYYTINFLKDGSVAQNTVEDNTVEYSQELEKQFYSTSQTRNLASINQLSALKTSFSYQDLRYIGQIFTCYLLCGLNDRFIIIDMHAAHERVNFHKIKTAFLERKIESQFLLITHEIQVETEELKQIASVLEDFGFRSNIIENNKNFNLQINETPSYLKISELDNFLKEFISIYEEYLDGEIGDINSFVQNKQDSIIARLACHASVRSGDYINETEVKALFQSLDKTPINSACPHGRPIVIEFSKTDVERWFGRDR